MTSWPFSRRVAAMGAAVMLLFPLSARAQPDLRQRRTVGALHVFPDAARRTLFYYAPGDLAIATREDGAPEVHLLHARYTGSVVNRDQGTAVVRSVFTVRVRLAGPTAAELGAARQLLATQIGRAPELRPLPIRRLESAIVYAAVNEDTGATALPAGHFEASDSAASRPEGFWRERVYTLRLGIDDAQLLSTAFERGQVALSVGYAFLADGIGPDQPLEQLSGSPALVEQLQGLLAKPAAAEDGKEPAPAAHLVRAGAFAVTADLRRWPGIIRRIDINESMPPGYAAVDVYCYDFNNGGETPLYEKQIEIEAAGVGGRPVTVTTTFSRSQPDIYAHSVRFPVAVRLDRPLRFRVTEVTQDGASSRTAWREQASWTALLDVTSQGERR